MKPSFSDAIDSFNYRYWVQCEQKVASFLPKIAQKVATHFLQNSDIIRNSPQSLKIIRATFVRQFIAKNL